MIKKIMRQKENIVKPQRSQSSIRYPFKDITEKIISCAIEVHSILGPGLLENLYEEALAYEFKLRKISFEKQKAINVLYKGKDIGVHRVDFLVENEIVLELKAIEAINKIHIAQVLTYLKAMNKKIGLLINFNVELLKNGIKRIIL